MLTNKKISAERYQKYIIFSIICLALIILTGAAVRLSESGLGCEDWPKCEEDKFVPEWQLNTWIEFGNRLLSGLVAVAVVISVLGAYKRTPKDSKIIKLAWGLVVGVIGQIVLGGVTVLLELHPAVVGAHFILSMVLLFNAVALYVNNEPRLIEVIPEISKKVSGAFITIASMVLLTGVIVTGSGPNSGDSRASRLGFDLETVSRIHGATVWIFLALTIWISYQFEKHADSKNKRITRFLSLLVLLQGFVGYLQYNLGVPPSIVAIHILGATLIWLTATFLYFRLCSLDKN